MISGQQGQSTLEWVIGAAVILGTPVVGIMAWNQWLGRQDKSRWSLHASSRWAAP